MQRLFSHKKLAAKPYYLTPHELTVYAEEFKDHNEIPPVFTEMREGVYVTSLPQREDAQALQSFKNMVQSLPHGNEILADYEEMLANPKHRPGR